MARSAARKPLPALAFLLALSLLTALVWWRVLHRGDDSKTAAPQPSCSSSTAPAPTVVPSPAAVNMTVLNSTTRQGLAASVGQALTGLGFKVTAVANDLTSRAPVTGVAEVRYGPAGKAAATLVSYYVPGATLVADTRTGASVDLALGAKYVALATAADVAKALVAAHITQLPAPAATTAATSAASATTSKSTTPSVSASVKSSVTSSATASC